MEVQKILNEAHEAARVKKLLIEQNYFVKTEMPPETAYSSILMFKIEKNPEWIELIFKLVDEEYKMRLIIVK